MGMFSCSHDWGFPRRWEEFQGKRNVDVQTCSNCGARRVSPVQFGRLASNAPAAPETPQVLKAVRS